MKGSGESGVRLMEPPLIESAKRPFIIPIFLPHAGCPHRCVFCNQQSITGTDTVIPTPENIRSLIMNFLSHGRKKPAYTQISFYGGNFLGLDEKHMISLLQEVSKFVDRGQVDSLRFSTRPDTVKENRLEILRDFPVKTIELGAQSMDNRVLAMANRGHSAADTKEAVALIKKHGYEAGVQIMVGLPGDNESGTLLTARRIAGLLPCFVRIYPTLVINNSPLAALYKSGKYKPLSLDESVTLTKKIYLIFREKKIPVVRMGLQASGDLNDETKVLAGPWHPSFGHLVYSEIFLDMAVSRLELKPILNDSIIIEVHPRNISTMRGIKNRNIEILKDRFKFKSIRVVPDPRAGLEDFTINPQA